MATAGWDCTKPRIPVGTKSCLPMFLPRKKGLKSTDGVSEKQNVEGEYPDNDIRKSCSALIRSFIISHSYIRMKLKLVF